ncbi:hypothetical protein L208DRAFT_1379717 [Tricholoma matsutake]|nr:hypothetical protein L208DRAFT_1379717 [Tricholoma matsutake 945]
MQKQQVRLVKAAGLEGDGMAELTEKQLVEKANVALDLMGLQAEDKPEGTWFMGVSKLNGVGGVMYEMDSEEAAEWLKGGEVMKAFIAKMGSTADYRAQTYEVVVDWVLTTLNMGQMGALESIEQASGLQTAAIHEAWWIKPIHLRAPGQRMALAIFGFSTCEGANHVIGFGLFMEGKKGSKMRIDTQGLQAVWEAAQNQRLSGDGPGHVYMLQLQNGEQWEAGRTWRFVSLLPSIPRARDPKTWETLEGGEVHRNFQDASWERDGNWQGGWTQGNTPRNQGGGQGQLAGGQREEGGNWGAGDNGWAGIWTEGLRGEAVDRGRKHKELADQCSLRLTRGQLEVTGRGQTR